MKKFSKRFKALPEKEKIKYQEAAEKDKERYEEHLDLVHENLIKKPAAEKKNGYHYFLDEEMKKALERGDESDIRGKAAEKWKAMDDEEQNKYHALADKNKELYEKLRNLRSEKLSAYALFVRDKMAQAKEKGESSTFKDVASKWKKASDKTKDRYREYAAELKDELDKNRDMIELTFNLKPSRPKSGYQFFQKECYDSGAVKGFGKAAEVKEKWDKLSDEERDKYMKWAKKESLIYIVKKRNYDAMIRKDLGKAPSALNLFYADEAKKNKEPQTLTEMYQKWKNSDAATKKKYQNKAKDAKEEFQKKVEEFKNRVYDKPKRALSAYNFFYKLEYKKMRDKNADLETKAMMKLMRDTWEKMTDKQVKVYEEMSEQDYLDKKDYNRQYESNGFYIVKESARKKRRTTKKKDSMEEGERASSKKKRMAKSPNKSTKKTKKV